MKQIGFTLMLFVVVLSPLAAVCQKLPDERGAQNPGTAATQDDTRGSSAPVLSPPDKEWRKIQKLPVGIEIVVGSTYGAPLSCRLAAATDDALYCDAPESPAGSGWQFDRAAVISVQATIARRNHHPGLLAAMIGGGMIVGMVATRSTNAGNAVKAGAIGALITGAAGAPLAMSTRDSEWETVVYRPRVVRVAQAGTTVR
jgi:hypothetical protein